MEMAPELEGFEGPNALYLKHWRVDFCYSVSTKPVGFINFVYIYVDGFFSMGNWYPLKGTSPSSPQWTLQGDPFQNKMLMF